MQSRPVLSSRVVLKYHVMGETRASRPANADPHHLMSTSREEKAQESFTLQQFRDLYGDFMEMPNDPED